MMQGLETSNNLRFLSFKIVFTKCRMAISKLLEQRCGLPTRTVFAPKIENAVVNVPETYRISTKHRAATPCGKTVAVDVDHINIRRARRETFIESAGTLVHQRKK